MWCCVRRLVSETFIPDYYIRTLRFTKTEFYVWFRIFEIDVGYLRRYIYYFIQMNWSLIVNTNGIINFTTILNIH